MIAEEKGQRHILNLEEGADPYHLLRLAGARVGDRIDTSVGHDSGSHGLRWLRLDSPVGANEVSWN